MGFRFQKRFSVLPGVKVNLSKSRVSTTIGGKGAGINIGPDGKPMVTVGIPGTGMSYRQPLGLGLAIAGIVVLALLVALAYFIAPDAVKGVLHWWQPKWF
jgi:Protein of unknown function (DUF4236)